MCTNGQVCRLPAEAEALCHPIEVHYNSGTHFHQVVHCIILPEGFPDARCAGDDDLA